MAQVNLANAFGLTPESGNDVISKVAFDLIAQVGYLVVGTTGLDGLPTARGLELHYLDESGPFYLGVAQGKPTYYELKQNPHLVGTLVVPTPEGLSLSVRLNARVRPVEPGENPAAYARYWQQNPGTKALYQKDVSLFRLFLLESGEGEIFYLPGPASVCRLRFGFGGGAPRHWAYEITENCIGCGACVDACTRGVIAQVGSRCQIDYFGCLECGRCAQHCPQGAIFCRSAQ